jgi:hypothetical protein
MPLSVAQTGVGAAQSVSLAAEHCPQTPLGWQAGRAGLVQFWSVVQGSPQVPAVIWQAGVVAVHATSLVLEHSPQVPSGWQAGSAGSLQLESLVHPALQLPVATSQMGVAPVQRAWFVSEHSPHVPSAWQAGFAGSSQLASVVHLPPQVPVAVTQTGVAPVHKVWLLGEHWPQVPSAWHAGFAGSLQLASVVQGEGTLATQVPVARSHIGRAAVQSVLFVAEHWPHWPLAWQAGAVATVHWASVVQPVFATHVPVVVLHTGNAAFLQSVATLHSTHWVPSQRGVGAAQRVQLVPHNAAQDVQVVPLQLMGSLAMSAIVVELDAASRSDASVCALLDVPKMKRSGW